MTRFITSVAALTEDASRDDLEVTLASVMFELAGPVELRLWRTVEQPEGSGDLRLRLRAHLKAGLPVALDANATDFEDLPRLSEHPDFCACLGGKHHLKLPPSAEGTCTELFAVLTDRAAVGILEMRSLKPLGAYQLRLVQGLLKIYRNHLKLLDASEYDPLTGLLNRRSFDEYQAALNAVRPHRDGFAPPTTAERRARVEGRQTTTCIAVADIDFFKRINDHFGHLYGDEVLVLLARLMRRSFRESDRLFRFGGEEFVVMLTSPDREGIGAALERFRASVESFAFPQVGRVTISIGYTEFGPADNGSDAFGRADKALYEAKRLGRNQVQCYEDLVAEGVLAGKAAPKAEAEEVEYF